MAKLSKSLRRERKNKKSRYGHTEDGRSVKLIQEVIIKRSNKIKKKKETNNG
jgi:hypothetical protein